MATQTTNIGLTLPIGSENVSLNVINGNMELIDEAVGELQEATDAMLVTREFTCTYSAAAEGAVALTQNNFGYEAPEGYTPIGIASFSSGSASAYVCYVQPTSASYFMYLYARTAITNKTARVTVLFIKTAEGE